MSKQQRPAGPATTSAAGGSGNTTLIVVALVMGGLTVLLTNLYISAVKAEARGGQITVYRLTHGVEPGHVLVARRDLREVHIPEAFRESMSDAITPAALENWEGEPILRFAPEGAPLTFDLFTAEADALDTKIAPGMRGTPLPLNSRDAPGVLRPGMFIDLSITTNPENNPRTLQVMERVRVIAIGSDTEPGGAGRRPSYSTITVEVKPEEALALQTISAFIGREGFGVSVRNPRDEATDFIGINPAVRELIGIERPRRQGDGNPPAFSGE